LVEGELAPTAIGRVYRVFDTVLNAVVAINVLSLELRHDEGIGWLSAFVRRARQAGQKVYDVGEWNGVPYVTLAYVEETGSAIDVAQYWRRDLEPVP
jgi:hypothetical protein